MNINIKTIEDMMGGKTTVDLSSMSQQISEMSRRMMDEQRRGDAMAMLDFDPQLLMLIDEVDKMLEDLGFNTSSDQKVTPDIQNQILLSLTGERLALVMRCVIFTRDEIHRQRKTIGLDLTNHLGNLLVVQQKAQKVKNHTKSTVDGPEGQA